MALILALVLKSSGAKFRPNLDANTVTNFEKKKRYGFPAIKLCKKGQIGGISNGSDRYLIMPLD